MNHLLHPVNDPFRIGKTYTIAQAARLAGTSPGTIRNWLFGAPRMRSVVRDRERGTNGPQRVSFLELIDFVVVAKWRREYGIDLEVIREAHAFAKNEWDVDYPFASLNMLPLGGEALRRFEETHPEAGSLVVMSRPGQHVLPDLVLEELERFDFDPAGSDPYAAVWHIHGRELPVVVDPRFGGGMPTVEGTGVTVDILIRRRKAGETRRAIASDFGLKFSVVDQILESVA